MESISKITILFIIMLAFFVVSSPSLANQVGSCDSKQLSTGEVIVQDNSILRHVEDSDSLCEMNSINTNRLNVVEKAIEEANSGETVLIREKSGIPDTSSNVGYVNPYRGAEISSNKDLTIKGEGDGVVAVQPQPSDRFIFDLNEIRNREITFENMIFVNQGGNYAIRTKSNSTAILDNIAIDGSFSDFENIYYQTKSIASSNPTGSKIVEDGVYYPMSSPPAEDVVVTEKGSGNPAARSNNQGKGINNPSENIFVRRSEPLEKNYVLQGSAGGEIVVDKDDSSSSDDSILNNFNSLQAAVNAADSNTVIKIYSSNTGYGSVEVKGFGVSGQHNLKITRANPNQLVDIQSIEFKYSGNYDIEKVHIINNLIVESNNINVDASENYWGSSRGPSSNTDIDVPRGVTSSISTQPFCESEDCQSVKTYEYPFCVNVGGDGVSDSTRIGCDSGQSSDFNINIGELENPHNNIASDNREFNLNVDSYTESPINVGINIIESDQNTDASFSMTALDDSYEEDFSTTFGGVAQDMVTDSQNINPRAKVTINDLNPVIIDLEEETITNPESFDSVTINTPGGSSNSDNTNVVEDGFTGVIPVQNRTVSRFNAGSSDSPFQDNSIPPITTGSGSVQSAATGELRSFSNMRTNSRQSQSVILPTSQSLNIGFKMENVPQAKDHTLVVDYAYQASDIQNNYIDVIVTDKNGNVITERDAQLKPTSDNSDIFTSPESEASNIGSDELIIELSSEETKQINNRGDFYFKIRNNGFENGNEVLHIYNSRVISTDNYSGRDSNLEFTDGSQGSADLSVSMDVSGAVSTEGTYDIEPGTEFDAEIQISNTGDVSTSGTYVLEDIYGVPDQNFPEDSRFNSDSLGDVTDTDELARFEDVTVQPGETITKTVSKSWSESEFGTHRLELKEEDDSGQNQDIYQDSTPSSTFYVEQPTTVGITNIDVPDERLKLSSFTAEVTLSNIGDLSGDAEILAEFGEWQSTRTIEFARSNARDGEDTNSDQITITYSRDDFEQSSERLKRFTRREYTTVRDIIDEHHTKSGPFENTDVSYSSSNDDSYYRADAPFAGETGEKEFSVTINTQELKGDNDVFDPEAALTTTESKKVNIYDIDIKDLSVNVNQDDIQLKKRPTEDEATVYASAWPYVYPSNGETPSNRPNGDRHPVNQGEQTLYSEASVGMNPSNRVSMALNNETVPRLSYGDEYFSYYYTHQNRVCNPEQLVERDGEVQVPESDASESDLRNVFMAFSASSCDDSDRITNTHSLTFVDTSEENVSLDSTASNNNKETDVSQPNTQETVHGVNPSRFDKIAENNHIMFGYVSVANDGASQPATARFEIVTDRELSDNRIVGIGKPTGGHQDGLGSAEFDDNVVGAAAVELSPGEEKTVPVPIVIRNNEGVDGIHELTVRPRKSANVNGDAEDYIGYTDEPTPPSEIPESPITGEKHDQWTVPIKVETYGDAVLKSFEPNIDTSKTSVDSYDPPQAREADMVVNEVCNEEGANGNNDDEAGHSRADLASATNPQDKTFSPDLEEGINVQSGNPNVGQVGRGEVQNSGTCEDSETDTELERAKFEATYKNYGGDTVAIRPEAIAEFESKSRHSNLHRLNAHATGDRYFAPYNEESQNTDFNGKTWSKVEVNGVEIASDESIEIDPGETKKIQLSRKFQEPGMYHIRMSPCRKIGSLNEQQGYGPQYYNLDGFTGIPDSISNTTSKIASEAGWADGRYTTSRTGLSRTQSNNGGLVDDANLYSTPEMENSVFHGSLGCANEASSVFVYDVTNPVAELRVAHDETTIMDNQPSHTGAIPQDGNFGFDEENLPPEVNIIFAIDQSGSVDDYRSDMRSDIVQFVNTNPDSYNYAYERFVNGGKIVNKDLGEYEDAEEFKDYMDSDNSDPGDSQTAPIGGGVSSSYDSFEESVDQLKNRAGPNTQNYLIVLGDGDQFDQGGCDDPSSASGASPGDGSFEIVGVYFGGSDTAQCDQNMQEIVSTVEGEELFYDTTENTNFIQSFNDFENSVVDRPTKVTEGGMLFLDASTVSNDDCNSCYNRPHFRPYELETPRESPDFPGGAGGEYAADDNGFRTDLTKSLGNLHSYIMSTDNARIVGRYMPGAYSEGDDSGLAAVTHPQIQEKGMEWEIEGGDPNYGQKDYCEKVEEETPDEHCYMERFEGSFGDSGNTPDSYEVVPHRFTNPNSDGEVKLQVWDDPTLTEGDANTNSTVINIDVQEDSSDPEANLGSEIINDLDYDAEDSSGNPSTWARKENIFNDVDYRSAPTNFGSSSKYDNTYEGVRTCFDSSGSDSDIGISQDEWTQTGSDDLDSGTRVIDDGDYVEEDGTRLDTLGLHRLQVLRDETRDGNRRCLIFEETGPDGNKERTQEFEYNVWDYANKKATATESIDVGFDTEDPTIASKDVNYESSVSDNNVEANDFIWAYRDSTSSNNGDQSYYRGGDLSFDIDAEDNVGGVGIACVDLRLNRGTGLDSGGQNEDDIHSNCAIMGDNGADEPEYQGLYENDGFNGALHDGMGTNDDVDGYHNDVGMFSAYELSTNKYKYSGSPNSGGEKITSETEKVYATDWHGNTVSEEYNIEIVHDQTRPNIPGSASCSGTSCSNNDIYVSSDGYQGDGGGLGGTPIVDAKITSSSSSWTKNTDTHSSGTSCTSGTSDSKTNAYVTSLPEGEHGGFVTVNNGASVSATAGCSSPGCSSPSGGEECSGTASADISYTWEYTLKIWDAHGNTQTKTFSGTLSDDASGSKKCSPCPENKDKKGGGGSSE